MEKKLEKKKFFEKKMKKEFGRKKFDGKNMLKKKISK